MTIWDILIWGGAGLTVLGLLTLVWCILTVIRARRAGTGARTGTCRCSPARRNR